MSDFLISATLELNDKMTAGIKSAKTSVTGLEQGMKGAKSASDGAVEAFTKTGSTLGDMAIKADRAKQSIKGIDGVRNVTIQTRDNATGTIQRVKTELSEMTGKTYAATVNVKTNKSSLTGLESGMKNAKSASDSAVGSFTKTGSTLGDMAAKADKAKQSLSGIKGNYSTTIHTKDNATGAIQKVKNELSGLSDKVYTANVNVKTNKAANAEGIGSKLTSGVGGVAGGMMMNTGMQMAGAAGIGFGIYDAVKGYMDFEKEMSAVKAISGASEADFQKLTDKAIQMGADTKFSAFESAQALEYMGMAGWKADEMMDGLPGIMNLAAASGEDLAGVADIVTDSMSAFKLQASDAAMFSDVLAAAATNSNTNVGKLGYSFKYVAPVAGALGYSIQDVSIALGTMADSGIKAEQAGTSMRELLNRMAKPTKESADAMTELGLSFTDAAGKVIPLRDQLKNIREAFAGKDKASQARLAAELAGTEGMSGLLAIVNQSQDKFDKLTDAIDNSQGAAERMAKTRLDNLSGDLEYLSGDWDTFTMKLMKGDTSNGLRSFVKEADNLLTHFADTVDKSGLGIEAFASTAGQAIVDLKNKFLELDGIGSVLAGGALMGGLYKITKWSMKAVDGIKAMAGKSGGTSLSGAAQDVTGAARDLMVNAQTVIVNGNVSKGVASAAEEAAGGAVAGRAGAGANGASKIGRFSKFLGRAAIPLAVLGGAYEMYNAKEGEKASTAGNVVGGLAGGIAGTKAGAVVGGGIGAMFGGVGAVPGAAIGGIVGGVGGAIAGSSLGQGIGSALGDVDFAGKWAGIKAGASETWDWMKNGASDAMDGIGKAWRGAAASFDSNVWEPLKESVSEKWAGIKSGASETWEWMKNGALAALQNIGDAWNGATGWLSGKVFEPLKNKAIDALNVVVGLGAVTWELIKPYWNEATNWMGERWQAITSLANAAWAGIKQYASDTLAEIQSDWGEVKEWFSEKWQSICDGASAAWTGIKQYASDTLAEIQSDWAMLTEWFGTAIWQPIADMAGTAWEGIKQYAADAWMGIQEAWGDAMDWIDIIVWQPIANTAGAAWSAVTSFASDTWAEVQGLWSEASGWFDSTVWQPISSAVGSVESAIVGAFSSAWSTVQGIWAGAAGWFDSVIIGPIKNNIQWLSDKYDELKLKGAGITGLGGSGGDSDDAPSSNWTGTTYFTPSYATGGITSFAAGNLAHGLAQVNEHGGELIDLPNGSRIYPVDTTERVIQHELNKGGSAWTSTGSNVNVSVPASSPAPVSVAVTGNTFVVREEADIDKIAHRIAQMFQQVNNNYGGAVT